MINTSPQTNGTVRRGVPRAYTERDCLTMQNQHKRRWWFGAIAVVIALSFVPNAVANTAVFYPIADNYTGGGGSNSTLWIDGSPVRNAWLKFNVSLPAGSTVTDASLDLYGTSSTGSGGFAIHDASNDGWTESGPGPSPGAPVSDGFGSYSTSGWKYAGLDRSAISKGVNSFVVRTASSTSKAFASRESSGTSADPRLVVVYSVAPPSDTTPPDTTITSGPSATTTSTDARFQFTSSDANSSFECRLDGGAWVICASPKDYAGLTAGGHTFEVRARDAAGNIDRSPASQTWTVQPSQPSGHMIPTIEMSLPVAQVPGTVHHMCSVWDTENTEIYPPGIEQNGDKHGTIRWEPGGLYAGSRKTYMLVGHRVISGSPGRMTAGHNQPADSPYGWTPLTAPNGEPNGVSPVAVDWFEPNPFGYSATIEPENAHAGSGGSGNYHYQLFTDEQTEARRGQWVWLWMEIVWGRKDGSTPGPGSLKIWVAGEDTPRVNKPNINTHWYGQGMLTFWECTYWFGGTGQGMTEDVIVQTAGPRFGHTPQEAYNDDPVMHKKPWPGDSGLGSWRSMPAVDGNVPVPAGLRW
jgi:hypothetical protein